MRFYGACEYCQEVEWCLDADGNNMDGCPSFKWSTCKMCIWHDSKWNMCRYTNESIGKSGDARCCGNYSRITEDKPRELLIFCDDDTL